MKRQRKRYGSGFTLIEVMITVAVVAILAAIAIPSYREYIRRGERAEAKSTMLQLQNWLQQQYTLNNQYPVALGAAPASLLQSPPTGAAKYNISFAATTAQTYTLQAVPTVADPKCGTLTITNNGVRANGGTDAVSYCWER